MRVLPGVSITRVVHNVPGGRRAWTFPYFGIRAGRRWWWPLGFGSVRVDVRPDTSRFEAGVARGERDAAVRPAKCSQCGQPFSERACGFTHALIAHERGLNQTTGTDPKDRP